MKPTLFIGSSRQRLAVARGLQRLLGDVAEVTVWDEAPQFAMNDAVLDGLIKVGDTYDFALLLFGQDDCTMMGSNVVPTVRDNVIFELGLFMGRLGKGRALWVSPSGPKAPHLASDLGGIVHLEIDEPDLADHAAIAQALTVTVDKLQRHIVSLGHRTDLTANVVPMRQALCLASSQYSQARFQEDIAHIHSFFSPEKVTSEQGVTAERFVDYFAPDRRWDIVHLGLFVDKSNEHMRFDGRETELGVQAVEGMIKDCGAALVVIITCDSLRFGEQLARFTNVVAGHQAIAPSAAISWAKVFYRDLSSGMSLTKAFDRAQDTVDPGLVLLARRDVRFALEGRR